MSLYRVLASALLALAACGARAEPEAASVAAALGAPVTTGQLQELRGGSEAPVDVVRLTGTTASNTARDVQTGTNTITGGAFASLNGIPVVIQNTGANVLIQNALILNLQLR